MAEQKQIVSTNHIGKALQKGYQLNNVEFFKMLQNGVNLLGALAPLLTLFFPQLVPFLTPTFLAQVTAAIAGLNVFFTTATTAKIGL